MIELKGKKGLIWGIIIGALIPFVPLFLTKVILESKSLAMTDRLGSNLLLLMLGIDLFIVWRTMPKKDYEFFGRGMILAMFVFVIYWVINYAL